MQLNKEDDRYIDALAHLHYENLPKSSPSLLGLDYVRSIYKYFSLSTDEYIISMSSESKKYSGLALYSANPATLGRRLLTSTPLIPALFKMCLTQWPRENFQSFRTMLSGSSNDKPELLFLCVDPSARGVGLGAQLVQETIRYSVRRNDEILSVQCEDSLVEFYSNLGFRSSPKKEGQYNFLMYNQTFVSPNLR